MHSSHLWERIQNSCENVWFYVKNVFMKLRKTKNKLVKKEFLHRLFVKLGTKKTRIGMRGMQGTRGMFKKIPGNVQDDSREY